MQGSMLVCKKSLIVYGLGLMSVVAGCSAFDDDYNSLLTKVKNRQNELLQQYVQERRFGQPIPKLEGRELEQFHARGLTALQWKSLCDAVNEEYERGKRETVFPRWVDWRNSDISAKIEALVKEAEAAASTNGFAIARAKFEAAREVGWQGSVLKVDLGGVVVPEVYGPVHKAALVLLAERVGVAEWPIVEREMNLIVTNAVQSANLDQGIAILKEYAPIRAYSAVLDGKVEALVMELRRLGVRPEATSTIVKATEKWMRQYERLTDVSEKSVADTITVGGGNERDLSIYKRLLREYEEALLKYDCTDANVRKIIESLAKAVAALVDKLPRPEAPVTVKRDRLVSLGATALNARLEKNRGTMIAYLERERAEAMARGKQLDELLRGNPEAAYAQVGRILLGVEAANEVVRGLAMRKLLTEINPALWKAKKKLMREYLENFAKARKCAEGVAWFAAHRPYVRTYAEDIDASFRAVSSAAVAFGVDKAKSKSIMDEIAKAAAEVEYLADYTDKIVDEVTPGEKIPSEKISAFESAVEACRGSLIRNGCTEQNADKLVAEIRKRFALERGVLEADVHKDVVFLGSNALNARLRAYRAECAGELLARCASALIAEKRYDEARALVRNVALSGDDEFDSRVYAMRIGVVNTVVTPVQFAQKRAEIEDFVAANWKKGDYRAVRNWMRDYPYVHDDLAGLKAAAKGICTAMERLKIDEPDPEKYVEKILSKVEETIESAQSEWRQKRQDPDLSDLERAVGVFEKAYLSQFYDKASVAAVSAGIVDDVKVFLTKPVAVMSVADVNAELRNCIEVNVRKCIVEEAEARKPRYRLADDSIQADKVKDAILEAAKVGLVAFSSGKSKDEVYASMAGAVAKPAVDWLSRLWEELNEPKVFPTVAEAGVTPIDELMETLVQRQEYLEFLTAMDKEVAYDSQIAMAEDAIAKQLCDNERSAHLQVNAMLGEYARAMRLLKQAKTLNKDQGAALVFGAVYLDQPAVLVRALELGADVNAVSPRDPLGRSALLLSIQLGRTSFMRTLVDRGANVKAVDAQGNTSVHYAVRRGNLAALAAMLSKVDVNAVNGLGETALFDASRANSTSIVGELVKAKVNVRSKNAAQWTALDAACGAGSRDVLDLLAAADAVFGPEQLIVAAHSNRLAVAQWLVSKGVDVNAPGVVEASKDAPSVRDFLVRQGGVVPPEKPVQGEEK